MLVPTLFVGAISAGGWYYRDKIKEFFSPINNVEGDIQKNLSDISKTDQVERMEDYRTTYSSEFIRTFSDFEDLTCEFLIEAKEEGSKSIAAKDCEKFIEKNLGKKKNDWPFYWLRVKKENFEEFLKYYSLWGEKASLSQEHQNWTSSNNVFSCSWKDSKIEGRVEISCNLTKILGDNGEFFSHLLEQNKNKN
ncbi:hypothetical protein PRV_02905 [Mycoplasma parvum str. Indiana]|uniref:Uncharacterized protein n=2 Tax=Mycoplasma parvum TaxID=984991 RepID=U5ND07_9MOLU|nr:hypothetical protein PRV_02905 [Mycoplasma parvum str. Indiana]